MGLFSPKGCLWRAGQAERQLTVTEELPFTLLETVLMEVG